ncbi:MAG: hypothetical protein M0C28_12700 [Candidatus Moduliflexus flocculans]|nr:hypothetical protein [Candidatus Moduliflexus flocculans]
MSDVTGPRFRHQALLDPRRTGHPDDRLPQGLRPALPLVPQSRERRPRARAHALAGPLPPLLRLHRGLPPRRHRQERRRRGRRRPGQVRRSAASAPRPASTTPCRSSAER